MTETIWFLDTSSLVDLVMHKGKSQSFESLIQKGVRVTNRYVLMELKRGVIQYLTYYHDVIVNAGVAPVRSDTLVRLIKN